MFSRLALSLTPSPSRDQAVMSAGTLFVIVLLVLDWTGIFERPSKNKPGFEESFSAAVLADVERLERQREEGQSKGEES